MEKVRRHIFLTGEKQIGKSTVIKRLLAARECREKVVGGFFTEPMIDFSGERVGFKLRLWDDQFAILAHRNFLTSHIFGSYEVNLDVFEKFAVTELDHILLARNYKNIVIMDELGRMETGAYEFQKKIFQILDGRELQVLGVVQRFDTDFLKAIRERPDVTLIHITKENRDDDLRKFL